MCIRKMTAKDNMRVKEIIQTSLEQLGLAIPGSAYFDPQLEHLSEYYQQWEAAAYWVLEVDGVIVGGVGIAPFDTKKSICELQKLYLIPKVQGRGYAKKLMDTALHFAKKHYKYCYLETMQSLEAACKLYVRYQFENLSSPLIGSEHSAMDTWMLKTL